MAVWIAPTGLAILGMTCWDRARHFMDPRLAGIVVLVLLVGIVAAIGWFDAQLGRRGRNRTGKEMPHAVGFILAQVIVVPVLLKLLVYVILVLDADLLD